MSLGEPDALFVYGTLRDPAVLEALLGKRMPSCRATLPGFRRIEPAGCYPYVVAAPGHSVDGLLVRQIDAAALHALDAYEGEGQLYRRVIVTVTLGADAGTAWVYAGIVAAHPVQIG